MTVAAWAGCMPAAKASATASAGANRDATFIDISDP
jgi:hypothetical protein